MFANIINVLTTVPFFYMGGGVRFFSTYTYFRLHFGNKKHWNTAWQEQQKKGCKHTYFGLLNIFVPKQEFERS